MGKLGLRNLQLRLKNQSRRNISKPNMRGNYRDAAVKRRQDGTKGYMGRRKVSDEWRDKSQDKSAARTGREGTVTKQELR